MNETLLRRLEALSRENKAVAERNEALTRQVLDLSKRFDASSKDPGVGRTRALQGADGSAPTASESAARPSRGGSTAPGTVVTPTTAPLVAGRDDLPDETAPVTSESAARPSRRASGGTSNLSNRLPLKPFYDQQRYGFLFETEDQEFELRVNALLQADARVYRQANQTPVVNNLDIPRARVYFSGRMTKPVEYQLSFQRGVNTFDLLNAYVNFHFTDKFQVRAGRFKPPFTFEWYKEVAWELLTPERSPFALNFGPNRQIGLMGWGFLFDERLEYAVALADGPRNSYQDSNRAKDVMALVDYKPFFRSGNPALKNLAIGGSLDHGREDNPLTPAVLRSSVNGSSNTLSTVSGDTLVAPPFLAFNNNIRERGDRSLWELHATYFYKGLSLLGVWDTGNNDYSQTARGARPVHLPVSGYFAQAAYLLTGETRERLSLIDPIRPFDLRRGKFGPGAFEVQARFSELALGNQVFTQGLADPNLWTNRVDMVDVGLNWYLNKFTKVYFDWEHAVYAQPVYYRPGGLQKTSDLFWFRLMIYL